MAHRVQRRGNAIDRTADATRAPTSAPEKRVRGARALSPRPPFFRHPRRFSHGVRQVRGVSARSRYSDASRTRLSSSLSFISRLARLFSFYFTRRRRVHSSPLAVFLSCLALLIRPGCSARTRFSARRESRAALSDAR